jgi:Tfp pilus assembly protein PilO
MSSSANNQEALQNQLAQLTSDVEILQGQLSEQTDELNNIKEQIPNTEIISPKFLNRSFAIWGHYFVANLIISIPIMCLILFLTLMLIAISPGVN